MKENVTKSDLFKQIGISIVTIGLGIGSGEFILWPYLTYNFGFGLLWGALLGISLQVFLNIEIQRYALVTGNSLVHGAYKLSKHFGLWFIVSTIIGFGWPGFSAGSAYLLSEVLQVPATSAMTMSVIVLILAGVILIAGKDVYLRIEKLLKIIIPFSFVVILIIFISYFQWDQFKEMLAGLFGQGGSYTWLPVGINLSVLLGAIVYAGSGGNLLLSQAYYVLEKKKFSPHFKENRKFQILENIFVFGGIGLLTILMLSYLSRVLTLPVSSILNDITFLPVQAYFITQKLGGIFGVLYLLTGAFALFAVQLGVLDLLGRISKEVFFLRFGKTSDQIYKFSVIIQVVFGALILLSGITQPLWLIIIGSVFNALAMGVIAMTTLILNTQLKKEYKPNIFTQGALILVTVFYISFFVITILQGK